MPLLVLSRAEVESLLPMAECIEFMAEALAALARGEALQPLRSVLRLPGGTGLLGTMPGHLGGAPAGSLGPPDRVLGGGLRPARRGPGDPTTSDQAPPGALGIKVITVFPGNHARGEDSHQGVVLLFDPESGKPVAVLEAGSITAIRTAAVSAVATRLLAREDAGDLALLGSGVQARTHLEALRVVRSLRRVRVWSRDPERARAFAARESARWGLAVEPAATPREAVEGADLVCTVTASAEPVLAGDWLAPGAHVNAVGACTPATRELDAAAVARARLFVDRRESALAEAGDFLLARREGAVDDAHILGELGDLLVGRVPGRRSAAEVTLFKSLGIAVEDLAAARHVVHRALAEGRGTAVDL